MEAETKPRRERTTTQIKPKSDDDSNPSAGLDPIPVNPWDEQDARAVKEAEGAEFKWRHGWSLTLRRISGWNKHWSEASAKLARRPDVKQFIARTSPKDYVYTEADRVFWKRVELQQFAEGCIVNWNVTARDGSLLALTPTNIMNVLTRFPDFLAGARTFAASEENYGPDVADDDDALGN